MSETRTTANTSSDTAFCYSKMMICIKCRGLKDPKFQKENFQTIVWKKYWKNIGS